LIKLFVLVAFSPIKLSHAADLLPLSQAEGGCSGGKVTSMHSLYSFFQNLIPCFLVTDRCGNILLATRWRCCQCL